MSDTIKPGVRVVFRAGKGLSEGRVANVAEGMATIATKGGKLVNRNVSQLTLVAETETQSEAEAGAV